MPDDFNDQSEQNCAIINFKTCIKQDGLILIDHKNYDHIINSDKASWKSSTCLYTHYDSINIILFFLQTS